MKAAILKVLAALDFEVLTYTMTVNKCKTLEQLVDKLAWAYNREDLNRIAGDLHFAYETRNK